MKKKIIILVSAIGLFLLGGFFVLAASVKIEYNYNMTLDTPAFDYSMTGNTLSITSSDAVLDTSTVDLVVPKDIQITDVQGVSSGNYNIYSNISVNEKLSLTAVPTKAYIYAHTVVYNDDKTIVYQNEYIDSYTSLSQANYSQYYNNLFDYMDNKDKLYSARFIITGNVEIESEYTITRPISLEVLELANLTLNANLNILNTHSGSYYMNNEGSIVNGDSSINLTASKASYLINDNIKAYVSYSTNVKLDDAAGFILNYLPNYITTEIYLPLSFMGSNISFKYEIGNEEAKESFTGLIDKEGPNTIYITIDDGEEKTVVSKAVILGSSDDTIALILEKELAKVNMFKDYDLLTLLNSLGIKRDLSFVLSDNAYFVYNDVNSLTNITLSYDTSKKVYTYNNLSIASLAIRRGLASSNSFTITVGDVSKEIYLADITKEEKVSYLKDYLHTYVVTKNNLPYDIIYVNDNKTYLGSTLLFDGILFDNLNYKVLDSKDTSYEAITYKDGSITFDNPEDDFDTLYLTYFDGDEELFRIDIKRSLNGSSGENSDFESNNPFDILFTDETNWLETNTFTMPANYSEFYANISIISINGVSYNYDSYTEEMTVRGTSYDVKTHNMISITKEDVLGTTNYAKVINIEINPNYIPSTNSIVSIRCELYNNGDGAKTVTAIHNYTLTIQGILKCGEEINSTSYYSPTIFSDNSFYNEIIEYLKTNKKDDYYQEAKGINYILANFKYLEEFNLGIASSDEIDISGIEMLTNATSIILDNINLKDLSPFMYFTSDSLKTLSLKNCFLTAAKLKNEASVSYLYSLELETLDLSNNDLNSIDSFNDLSSIDSFSHMFFRTITVLNLNNTMLTTVLGIDDVISVETLDIRNNKIDNFESLKYLKNLKNVHLGKNTNASNYYGTNGLINQCVYYWMLKTNKTNIYLDDDALYKVDEALEPLILALNAFVIPTKIGSAEKEYLNEKFESFSTSSINFKIIKFESGKLIIEASKTDSVAYREFYYEVA